MTRPQAPQSQAEIEAGRHAVMQRHYTPPAERSPELEAEIAALLAPRR